MNCSEAVKLAGFKSKAQAAELAGISIKGLFNEFVLLSSPARRSKFYDRLRKAMDEKQMLERFEMELAIVKIKEKGSRKCSSN